MIRPRWLAIAAAAIAGWSCSAAPVEPPHVLLITLDTTRGDHVFDPVRPDLTPNLDRLATRASVFTAATSESNVTNPSHATIFTGLPSIQHGVLHNARKLAPEIDTLAKALRRQGYRTAALASVRHVGEGMGWQGFTDMPRPERMLRAADISDRAIERLTADVDTPLFLWAHYWDPHTPYRPPDELAERYYPGDPSEGDGALILDDEFFQQPLAANLPRGWLEGVRDPGYGPAMYAAEVHETDRQIGRVLDALADHGLSERTIVIVVGDHGESLGEHDILFDHAGLYEPQLKIPLLIRVPGAPAGRWDTPVSTLDIAPTLASLLGLSLEHPLPGRDLSALLRAEPGADTGGERILVHMHSHNRAVAVRDGDWKLIWPIDADGHAVRADPELYHLGRDPGERTNLAATHPDRVTALVRHIGPWQELGMVRLQSVELTPEAKKQLESLGYIQD